MSDMNLSEALSTVIEATEHAERTGNTALATKLGQAYQVLGDEVIGGEKQHTVNESADKIVLKTSVKRGTGTRDQDKVNVKAKGNNPAETAQKLKETLQNLEEMDVANHLRNTQPGENDD